MNAQDIVAKLWSMGYRLRVADGQLIIKPASTLPAGLKQLALSKKAEIVALIGRDAEDVPLERAIELCREAFRRIPAGHEDLGLLADAARKAQDRPDDDLAELSMKAVLVAVWRRHCEPKAPPAVPVEEPVALPQPPEPAARQHQLGI